MDEFFKRAIIDELFEVRSEDFENQVIKTFPKEQKDIIEGMGKIAEELELKINEILNIVPQEKQKELSDLFDDFERLHYKDSEVWRKVYYKFGIIDGFKLKNELYEGLWKNLSI